MAAISSVFARVVPWPSLARPAAMTCTSLALERRRGRQLRPLIQPAARKTSTTASSSYTTAFALFEALWEAGITACFVNLGSDHPSILEAIVRGKRERADTWPRIVTCPAEMTAISMADGYARLSGRPQAVLVHVDVGTQALGQGIHNASVGRVPVLILAGLCPDTESGELTGSRTEYQHWLQEAPDQTAIVRQYCRYAGEIRAGSSVKQMVGRALQFASSAPAGPTYLVSAREVLAQEISRPYSLDQEQWKPLGPGALPHDAATTIATALVGAERPLVLTGYSGRDHRTLELLVALADLIPGIRVHNTSGSDVCLPFSHIASEGYSQSQDECSRDADAVLVLDCNVPWIPSRNAPPAHARIYHVGGDPLNQQIPKSFFPGHGHWKADAFTALSQLVDYIKGDASLRTTLQGAVFEARRDERTRLHQARLIDIQSRARLGDDDALDEHNVGSLLKAELSDSTNTTFVVEAVTLAPKLFEQVQPSRPGSWINCGGAGIGWSNGAALGVKMALADKNHQRGPPSRPDVVCQIVGDGSFMCASPSSALWVASKYKIPILTVVLNNAGWKAPRVSAKFVHPEGLSASASDEELNISFKPTPNYAALAEAAAGSDGSQGQQRGGEWMKGERVRTVGELRSALKGARSRLIDEGKGMLIEAIL